jgi:hypothetical protein
MARGGACRWSAKETSRSVQPVMPTKRHDGTERRRVSLLIVWHRSCHAMVVQRGRWSFGIVAVVVRRWAGLGLFVARLLCCAVLRWIVGWHDGEGLWVCTQQRRLWALCRRSIASAGVA